MPGGDVELEERVARLERHAVDEEKAFQMLRDYARRRQSVLVDAAESVVAGAEQPETR